MSVAGEPEDPTVLWLKVLDAQMDKANSLLEGIHTMLTFFVVVTVLGLIGGVLLVIAR